jgi:hypothetical protein
VLYEAPRMFSDPIDPATWKRLRQALPPSLRKDR